MTVGDGHDGPEWPYTEVTPNLVETADLSDNPYQNVDEAWADAAQAAGGDNPYVDVEAPKQDPKVRKYTVLVIFHWAVEIVGNVQS